MRNRECRLPLVARLFPLALALGSAARADVCLERWWSVGGGQTSGTLFALAVFDAGDGPRLYVGGASIRGSGAPYGALARWSGETWEAFAAPTSVSTTSWLGVLDSGDGVQRLHVAGLSGGLFRWNGAQWVRLGSALSGIWNVATLPAGSFTTVYAVTQSRVYRLDNDVWTLVGQLGSSCAAPALLAFDDGSGPKLYVGGSFTSIAEDPEPNRYRHMASFDGSTWAPLGEIFGSASTQCYVGVRSLAVFDAGDRSRLYAGGSFNLSGGPARGALARWGGQAWEEVAVVDEPNNNSSMNLLRVVDDGGGPALYAAGTFASINGVACRTVAKWTGATWSAVGGGVGKVEPRTIIRDIAAFPSGTASIHVAGVFSEANGGASRLNGLAVHEERCLCPDVDGSGAVDQGDLDELLFRFNQQSTADADGDGWVTQADLDLVLFTFGETCP